jgi:hypothetical protein
MGWHTLIQRDVGKSGEKAGAQTLAAAPYKNTTDNFFFLFFLAIFYSLMAVGIV